MNAHKTAARAQIAEKHAAQVRELRTIIHNLSSILEDAAQSQDIMREKLTGEPFDGFRFIMQSNADHWRKLVAEYHEQANKA